MYIYIYNIYTSASKRVCFSSGHLFLALNFLLIFFPPHRVSPFYFNFNSYSKVNYVLVFELISNDNDISNSSAMTNLRY